STKPRSVLVGAYCRGQLLDTAGLERGETEAVLHPRSGAGGVCRITVFEELLTGHDQRQLKPVAERLVYRHPKERLDVSISADHRRYVPGQKAKESIPTTNESERLAPSLALVSVVDKSVVTLADEKTDRAMPTHFLLTTEVRRAEDLEYADFLVGPHPKAAVALDLLLGTQGWRRFAEQDPERFRDRLRKQTERLPGPERQREEEEGERRLVMTGQSAPQKADFDQEKIDRVLADCAEKSTALLAKHEGAARALAEPADDGEYRSALATLGRYHDALKRGREIALPVLAVLAVLLAL